jgi:hypothetical protein
MPDVFQTQEPESYNDKLRRLMQERDELAQRRREANVVAQRIEPGLLQRGVEGVKDVVLAPFRGTIEAVNEVSDAGYSAVRWLSGKVNMPGGVSEYLANESNPIQLPNMGEPTTVVGGIATAGVQFAAGMVGIGKFTKVIGLSGKAGGALSAALKSWKHGERATKYAGFVAKAAATDAMVFDPYEGRLSELAVKVGPEFMRPYAEFLISDEDEDSELEARAKAALEGFLLGSTIDGVWGGTRALRAWRKMRKAAEVGDEVRASLWSKRLENEQLALKNMSERVSRMADTGVPEVRVTKLPDGSYTIRGADESIESVRQQWRKDQIDLVGEDIARGAEPRTPKQSNRPYFRNREEVERFIAPIGMINRNTAINKSALLPGDRAYIIRRMKELDQLICSVSLRTPSR